MIKNYIRSIGLIGSLVFFYHSSISAASLVQVYSQALKSDPTFKEDYANWLSARENLAIARAGSAAGQGLFPRVTLSGGVQRNYNRISPNAFGGASDGWFNSNVYAINLAQPVFNAQTWASIATASDSVKAATASFLYQAQDLIMRTANAYFAVLQADAALSYTIANKKAVLNQLEQAQEQYNVGLIAITGVYEAEANYDAQVAQEISDRNALSNAIENLRAITGVYYMRLNGLAQQVPLLIPQPKNMQSWINIGIKQNYNLKAQEFTVLQQQNQIKVDARGRWPVIQANVSYTDSNNGSGGIVAAIDQRTGIIGLSANFPIIQGGYVSATVKQDKANYLSALDTLEYDHRNVINQTSQAYLGIVSGMSKIKADAQTIVSQRNSLKATEAEYQVGTRTMVDVLNAISNYYLAKQTYVDDQYSYILSILTLKEQAGTLSYKDLYQINHWLPKSLNFKSEIAAIKIPYAAQLKSSRQHKTRLSRPMPGTKAPTPSVPASSLPSTGVPTTSTPSTPISSGPYGIQFYASTNQEDALQFLTYHSTINGLRMLKEQVNGQTWYKVVLGHYNSKSEAEQALKLIPQSLFRTKPWIVTLPKHEHDVDISKLTQDTATSAAKIVKNVDDKLKSLKAKAAVTSKAVTSGSNSVTNQNMTPPSGTNTSTQTKQTPATLPAPSSTSSNSDSNTAIANQKANTNTTVLPNNVVSVPETEKNKQKKNNPSATNSGDSINSNDNYLPAPEQTD